MTNTPADTIELLQQRLTDTKEQLSQAAQKAGRSSADIQLLAVSKTQAAEALRMAFSLGQRAFGENYLQEARDKQQVLNDLDIEWHFIGPIQSNKTREIAEHFHWVHSVDRLKIAQRLSKQRPETLAPLNICLQINVDNEKSKFGILLNEIDNLVNGIASLPNLKLRGLMAIPAPKESYEDQLITFKILTDTMAKYPKMDTLSMGMSSDMSAAIEAGSTMVRVGTGIFGKRQAQGKQLEKKQVQ
ncbi:MAG: YggS family pyridoxal phosphate-dependent enzyme [Cellvibrionaceae bacterium]